jgi:hypothetical protein
MTVGMVSMGLQISSRCLGGAGFYRIVVVSRNFCAAFCSIPFTFVETSILVFDGLSCLLPRLCVISLQDNTLHSMP